MEEVYISDQTFDKYSFAENRPEKGEYENCIFKMCDFSGYDLSGYKFSECDFIASNLSLVKLNTTALQNITFRDCKLMGLHFYTCNEFALSLSFDGCILNHSSFYRMKLRKTSFTNSQLQETDFTECDLSSSIFDRCDLTKAMFENSILEKVDFRSASNYIIDPEINRIKRAKFSLPGVTGLLSKYDIVIED
jgi:uncharacterized protein YjbI with pentapeptide repeats